MKTEANFALPVNRGGGNRDFKKALRIRVGVKIWGRAIPHSVIKGKIDQFVNPEPILF